MQQHIQTISEYQKFSRKIILTSACSVLLASSVGMFMQSAVSMFALPLPGWVFALLEMALACLGLWWTNRNDKQESAKSEGKPGENK